MINVYICLMCFIMSGLFYILEYKFTVFAIEYNNKSISASNSLYLQQSANGCLWLARLFLISAVALSVIEQVQFIKAG